MRLKLNFLFISFLIEKKPLFRSFLSIVIFIRILLRNRKLRPFFIRRSKLKLFQSLKFYLGRFIIYLRNRYNTGFSKKIIFFIIIISFQYRRKIIISSLLTTFNKLIKLLFIILIYPLNINYLIKILLDIKYFYYLICFLITMKFNSIRKAGI